MTPQRRNALRKFGIKLAPIWPELLKRNPILKTETLSDEEYEAAIADGTPKTDGTINFTDGPASVSRPGGKHADGTPTSANFTSHLNASLVEFRDSVLMVAPIVALRIKMGKKQRIANLSKFLDGMATHHPAWKDTATNPEKRAKWLADEAARELKTETDKRLLVNFVSDPDFPTNEAEETVVQAAMNEARRKDADRGKKILASARAGGEASNELRKKKNKSVQAKLPELQKAHDDFVRKGHSHSNACKLVAKKIRNGRGAEYLRKVLKNKPVK